MVFTFENFNTGQSNGVATLYLDGESRGALSPREQTFTWELDKAVIGLGLNYVGLFDELAILQRALNPEEVAALYRLDGGVRSLLAKNKSDRR